MKTRLIIAKRWNDESVLKHEEFQTLLDDWLKVDHEGDNNAGLRIINSIVKCKPDLFSVRVWLQHAFDPERLAADHDTVEIYLNFFSKLRIKGDDALQYLNDERHKRKLSLYLNLAHTRIVQQPVRRLLAVRFTRNKPVDRGLLGHDAGSKRDRPSSARPSVELQPKTQNLEVTLQSDELGSSAVVPTGKSAGISEESADIAKIEPGDETLLSQSFQKLHDETSNMQDGIPFDASHEADAEVFSGGKRKGLDHDMSIPDMRHSLPPDPVGCQDQPLVDQIPSDDAGRTTKRQKVDRSITTNHESHSLPSKHSVSNAVPCTPQGKRGKSIAIAQARKPNTKDIKGKGLARSFQPKVGPETHPPQDGGILDVCCQPSSNYDHMDIPDASHLVIVELEGRQQAQDSHLVNDDLGLVTMKSGQLDSKPQSSMTVLDSEGPRELFPCCMNDLSMEDEKLQHSTFPNMGLHSNFTDNSDMMIQSPPKRDLHRLPPIWAESRQEVCEAFDWFRSYQGGVYHAENTVKGYLLSAFASKRDVFEKDGRVIISHGGGKSESIGSHKGLFVSHQASDQLADDKSVRALLDNYRSGRPLVLMVDDKYALFPYDLSSRGVTYAVLGFYSIVYAWAEFQPAKNEVGRVIRFKFAFRWCEEQGTPWWCFAGDTGLISKGLSNSKDKSGVPRIVSEDDFSRNSVLPISNPQMLRVCSFCRSFSQKVYSTWVCLATNCEMFWRNPETQEFAPDNLKYDNQFIALLPKLPLPFALNLVPKTTLTRAMNGTSTSYAFTRGIHCPNCGRLSSRYQWEQLECRACQWTKKADIDIRSAKDFWCDRLPISFEYFQMSSVSDLIPEPIRSFRHETGKGSIQTFTLPYNRGFIHHIQTPCATAMLDADKIFNHYQEDAKSGKLKFRRWPLKAHKCRGTLLTNYFSHNTGEPYQYVGSDANTVPFEQVPAVIEARQLIRHRILQALDRVSEFNEVLSCAYMERQKMAFHSDAEVGLGPLVAGLSLGSPALMHFRIAARHDPLYEQRGVLLTVVLRHGDVLVMDGNGVQEYYEHTVVPNNFRIAATARQITPKPHETPS